MIGSPEAQLKLGFKAAAIASALNRAPPTISRDEFSGAHAFQSD
jgi:hypothetical protein